MKSFVVNESVVDVWTAAHFAWGLFFRAVGLPLWVVVVIATIFEFLETPLERLFPSVFPFRKPDTLVNAIGDVAGATAGWIALDTLLSIRES